MRAKLTWADIVMLVVWLLPLAYFVYVYPQLPNNVALHFNLKGEPDRWGHKQESIFPVMLIFGVSIVVALLVRFLPNIDPKKKVKYSQPVLVKLSYALVFFMSAMNVVIIYSTKMGHFVMNARILYPAIFLLMAYLGNLFNNLKPNYFVGVRTPWTLENEVVWKKTHQLAGRLWLGGGVLLAILTFATNGITAEIIFGIGVATLVLIPIIYSYIYYQKTAK